MITRDVLVRKKVKIQRLALIKERYHKLILRQRQDIERELRDHPAEIEGEEEFDSEAN